MAEKILMFNEYTHRADGIGELHPYVILDGARSGKWFFTQWPYEVTFNEVIALCNIPEDEEIILKLKYGASRTVAH